MTHLRFVTTTGCPLAQHGREVLDRLAEDDVIRWREIAANSAEGRLLAHAGAALLPLLVDDDGRAVAHGRLSERRLRRDLTAADPQPAISAATGPIVHTTHEEPSMSTPAPSPRADQAVLTVTVFDPALCCSTGVCGPSVDPALVEFARDVRWLEGQGVTVRRFGLTSEPAAFAENGRVQGLLAAFGTSALPAVLVNDEIIGYGRYPTREELETVIRVLEEPRPQAQSCCGGSGSGRC